MPRTIKGRRDNLASLAGPLANVKVTTRGGRELDYRISCRECMVSTQKDMHWSTYRPEGNAWIEAVSRWNRHLTRRHPEAAAPGSFNAEAVFRQHEAEDN